MSVCECVCVRARMCVCVCANKETKLGTRPLCSSKHRPFSLIRPILLPLPGLPLIHLVVYDALRYSSSTCTFGAV